MGFTIEYQRVIRLYFWQYHWLLRDTEVLLLPPINSAAAVQDRVIDYNLRNILRVELTPTSQKELEKRGLIFKATTTGALVASKISYAESDPTYRLSFAVNLVDPNWQDYTLTGVDDIQSQIFHLTNFDRTPAARTLLTDGGNETLRLAHYLPRQGRIVRLTQSVPGTASTVEVYDDLSNAATPVLTFVMPAVPGQEEYELDCRSLREGKYRFEGANITNATLYLGLENQPALLGVVDLFTAGWGNSEYDVRLAQP